MSRAALAVALLLAAAAAVIVPGVSAAPRPGLVTLAANVLPGLDRLTPTGSPDPQRRVVIGVGLRRPDPAGELAALHRMYDPKSPEFHHFLTPAEFARRFGVDQAAHDRLTSWLHDGGLDVTQAGSSRDYVQAMGTAADVARLFHTTLRTFVAKGVPFMANTTPPRVPADIPVASVIGLNDLQKFSTPSRPKTAARPAQGPLETGLLSPQDLWNIYEQPSNNMGQGETVGVFGEGATDSVIKDLRQFEKEHGFRQIPVTVKHVGKGPFDDTSGAVEWNLDTQAATGMAPNAYELQLYFTSSLSDADVLAEFSQWVSDANGPRTMNASFGECETDPLNPVVGNPAVQPTNPPTQGLGNNLEPVSEPILRQAVMQGRTLFASTGDTGSSCPVVILPVIGAGNGILNQAVPLLGYPAASPYAVGVGGTVLYTDGNQPSSRVLERSWEFTGGGTSIFITAPDFQQGVPNIVGRCVSTFDGTPDNSGMLCRGIPDVAAISGDVVSNGYAIVVNGQSDYPGGGTSLSSPVWAGMWTRVQAASPNSGGAGFANAAFYAVGKDATAYANDFFDITVGTNGIYTALPGWDYVTGWGVPRLTGLMTTIDGKTAPTRNVLPPLPTTAIAPVNPACFPLWVDPADDDNYAFDVRGAGMNPQLDLLQGDLVVSPDGKTLKAKLTINNLSTATAPGSTANEYYLSWTYNKVTYFANAEVDITGATTFHDGTVDATGPSQTYNNANTVTGSIGSGRRGVVEIDVPVADVGSPGKGAVLTSPAGLSAALVGAPAVGGSLPTVDTGGPQYDLTIGATCVAAANTSRPAPAPQPAPRRVSGLPPTGASPLGLELGVAAAGLAAGLAWLRRRASAWPDAS